MPKTNRFLQLPAPAVTASRMHLADWIEMSALQRNDTVSVADVKSWLNVLEDPTDLGEALGETVTDDSLDLDESGDLIISEVFLELERRGRASVNYPFDFIGTTIRPKSSFGPGEYTYAFSLFSTECAYARILPASFFTKSDRKDNQNIFQTLGTIAASGFVAGNAMSFGFPRQALPGFTEALASLVNECIKEGSLHKKPLAGAAKFVKDGGIDVVAWRHFPDELPGKILLMGQCATGANDWDTKSVKSKLPTFYSDFFCVPPPTAAIEVLFIPFALDVSKKDVAYGDALEDLAGVYRHYTVSLGIIIDRCRLAYLCPLGLSQIKALKKTTPELAKFSDVKEWVDYCLEYLRNAKFLASLS